MELLLSSNGVVLVASWPPLRPLDSGVPLVGVPLEGVPLEGVPLVGVPSVGVPLVGVPSVGVPWRDVLTFLLTCLAGE